ncbi:MULTISPECIES: hypothetical protein [unclassified Pseudomonas]|jgi:hypothetical protein|uniref:hypothetical protein n=1 Tax=unclassified Pseudomonas TaxID=196821 RepID=UPI00030C9C78|nr:MULTISPECIES: hypothetical protein [unclassified Pseudomonas]MBD9545316.1 hypothetical protein [Pseudomonas sp. PDM01]
METAPGPGWPDLLSALLIALEGSGAAALRAEIEQHEKKLRPTDGLTVGLGDGENLLS